MNVQKLTHENEKGELVGPFCPTYAAKEMVKQDLITGISDIYRLHGPEELHQIEEKGEGLTGHDTLIVKAIHSNTTIFAMVVDQGVNIKPVALWFSDSEDINITPIYERSEYLQKLSQKEILEAFQMCIEN